MSFCSALAAVYFVIIAMKIPAMIAEPMVLETMGPIACISR